MKSKFAGLAEARLKALDGETERSEKPAKPAKQKAKKKASPQASKSTSQQVHKPASKQIKLPQVSARTSEENRTWWIYQARLQKTTLQKAIIEALEKRFGLPKKVKL